MKKGLRKNPWKDNSEGKTTAVKIPNKTSDKSSGSVESLQKSTEFFMPGELLGYQEPPPRTRLSPTREVGYPSLHIAGGHVQEDFIPDLTGRRGIAMYEEMRKNDPVVGSMLLVAEQLIHNATVFVDASETNPDAQESKMAQNLVKTSLYDMGYTWTDTLSEILTFLAFGWAYSSVWLKKRDGYHRNEFKSSRHDDGKFGWAAISLRKQSSLLRWEIDSKGRALGMIQQGPPLYTSVFIPKTNAAHFRTKTEGDSPEAVSILRNAFRPYLIKKNLEEVEAIGLEKDLTGVAVVTVPEGLDIWNPNDANAAATLERANNIARLSRVDKYSGIVLPFGWTIEHINTPGQRAQNSDTVISRWDQRIAVTLLADMLLIGHERVGSFALVQSKTRLFSSALESYAARIAGVFNRQLIPRMMLLNGIAQEYWPTLRFGSIDAPALAELAEMLKAMNEVGLNVDEVMGLWLRGQVGIPPPREGDSAVQTFEAKLEEQKQTQEMMQKFKPDPSEQFGGGKKPEGNEGKPKPKKNPGNKAVQKYSLGMD